MVAAGAIESARLLLLSKDPRHPNGVGNDSGHVGRHLLFHHYYTTELRYGDALRIETSVKKVGNRSAVLHYRMINARTGALSADVSHTVVTTDLRTLTSCDMPDDVRARLLEHKESSAQ